MAIKSTEQLIEIVRALVNDGVPFSMTARADKVEIYSRNGADLCKLKFPFQFEIKLERHTQARFASAEFHYEKTNNKH